MRVDECLNQATEKLRLGGVAQPRLEAASLLSHAIGRNRTFLFAHPEYELDADEQARFDSFAARRAAREPFQHITGFQEFYGLDFAVSPDVLIPRPESELLVETAIEILRRVEKPRFCEIGTGSGCISVAILHELPRATAVAVDISKKAIDVASRNASANGVAERIELAVSDVFSAFGNERFCAVLSNPPYIPAADIARLQQEVRDFDPRVALTDGGDGLSIVEKIVAKSPTFLLPGGFLLLEIGHAQADRVRKMFNPTIWKSVEFLRDLQGIERTIKAGLRKW